MDEQYLKEQFALAIKFRNGTDSQRELGKIVVEQNRSAILSLMKVV
jgi:hypothetical protein